MTTHSMPKGVLLAAAAALALVGPLAPAAAAATLFSPPIMPTGGVIIDCAITNLTATALSATLKALDNDRVVGSISTTVGAQNSKGMGATCVAGCVAPRCQFVTNSPASSFRAIACVRGPDAPSTSMDKACQEAR